MNTVGLVPLLLFLVSLGRVESSLFAYYPLNNGTVGATSGSCQVNAATLQAISNGCSSTGAVTPGVTGAFNEGFNFIADSRLNCEAYQIDSPTALSVSTWIRPTVISGNDIFLVKTLYTRIFVFGFYEDVFDFRFNEDGTAFTFRLDIADSIQTVTGGTPLLNTWTHLVATYDGTDLVLYQDSLEVGRETRPGQIQERSGSRLYIGGPPKPGSRDAFSGDVDEVQIYNNVLTQPEIADIFSNNLPDNGVVSATIIHGSEANTTNAEGLELDITEAFNPSYSYQWSIVNSPFCADVLIVDDTSKNTDATFGEITGTFEFEICVSSGSSVAKANVQVQVIPSVPIITSQPEDVTARIGESARFTINVLSIPSALVQWQFLTLVENRTHNGRERSMFDWDLVDHQTLHWQMNEDQLRWLQYDVFNYPHEYQSTTHRRQTVLEVWRDIADAAGFVYETPEVTTEDDGLVLRCLVINNQGVVESERVTLTVTEGDDGDGDGDDSAIIAGIVLGVCLCCLCCYLILILVIVLVLVLKGRSGTGPKNLYRPEWQSFVYQSNEARLTIPSESQASLEEYAKLLQERPYILAIGLHATSINIAKHLVWVIESNPNERNGSMKFIRHLIEKEVQTSNNAATLFRANSTACQAFTVWVRMLALDYLWSTLVVPVNEINDNAWKQEKGERDYAVAGDTDQDEELFGLFDTGMTLEINPDRLDADAKDTEVNTLQLWLTAQKLILKIFKSEASIPKDLKELLCYVQELTTEKFGDDTGRIAIGSFFFLRFVCPSLLAPHTFGLLPDPPHKTAQRQLVLIGKVIQNLANGTLPGAKEKYMERLNEFIDNNTDALHKFYDTLQNRGGPQVSISVPKSAYADSLVRCYCDTFSKKKRLFARLDKIEDDFEEDIEEIKDRVDGIIDSVGQIDSDKKKKKKKRKK